MEGGSAAISEYEQERLATIQSNRAKLVELGLEPAEPGQEAPKTKAKRERRAAEVTPREPTRQSKRVRSAAPDYTGVKIDAFGDDEPKLFRALRRSSAEIVSDVGEDPEAGKKAKEEAAAAVREAALAWASLRKERAASSPPLAQGAEGWRAEAVRRWGDKAALAETDDWESYVISRTATPPPPSPMQLMQVQACPPYFEHFHYPWRDLARGMRELRQRAMCGPLVPVSANGHAGTGRRAVQAPAASHALGRAW
jgi:hypothetical protein